jgi:hypothetical protein
MRDYYGKIIDDENYADPETGWRNNFFIMKSNGEWRFRMCPDYRVNDGFWKPFCPREPKKKFSIFGGMKIFANEKSIWTNESDFMK